MTSDHRKMKSVVIVQRRLTHYRKPFFQLLKDVLSKRGIELKLLYGAGTLDEEVKKDGADINWANKVSNRYLFGDRLCWQSIRPYLRGADLVVVTQENALLFNYLLMFWPRRFKLAFWGHGANLQSTNPHGFSERFKKWTTKHVDWWFAYTQKSAALVSATGFPNNRVTILNNSVDTSSLREQLESITAQETVGLKRRLGVGAGPVGIFVGSFYPGKRIEFLFQAAKMIRREISDFHLLLVGDGPEHHRVKAWCIEHPWTQWVGARFGRDKALYLSMAHVMLNPGVVGLGILDAFTCGVPILTTDCGIHSPEIAYLENGFNGVMTKDSLSAYTDAAVKLMQNPKKLSTLRSGCTESACRYTLDNMAHRFVSGIVSVLGESP